MDTLALWVSGKVNAVNHATGSAGAMRHDWIFEVLQDLRSYAERNGLPAVAESVADTLRVAQDEIAAKDEDDHGGSVPPEGSRTH